MMQSKIEQAGYWTDEKDVFDHLTATKVGVRELKNILLRRGIICSKHDDVEALRRYISYIYLDWNEISDLLSYDKVEEDIGGIESCTVTGDFNRDTINEAIEATKTKMVEAGAGGVIQITHDTTTNEVALSLNYLEIKPSLNRTLQRHERDAGVWVKRAEGKLIVRHTSGDPHAAAAVARILGNLAESNESAKETIKTPIIIDLSKVAPQLRTKFMMNITHNSTALSWHNTVSIGLSKTGTSAEKKIETPEDPGAVPNASINSAKFGGNKLHETEEFIRLIKSGFYVTSIQWQAVDIRDNTIMIEVEAKFSERDLGRCFSYRVTGFRVRDLENWGPKKRLAQNRAVYYHQRLDPVVWSNFEEIIALSKTK